MCLWPINGHLRNVYPLRSSLSGIPVPEFTALHTPVNPPREWWVGAFDTPSVALSLEAEAQHFLTQLVALRASTVHSVRVTFRLPEYRLDF